MATKNQGPKIAIIVSKFSLPETQTQDWNFEVIDYLNNDHYAGNPAGYSSSWQLREGLTDTLQCRMDNLAAIENLSDFVIQSAQPDHDNPLKCYQEDLNGFELGELQIAVINLAEADRLRRKRLD